MSLRGRALGAARGDVAFIFQQFNLIRRVSAMQDGLVGRLAQTPTWRVVSRRFSYADRQLALRCAVVVTGVAVVASLHQVHLALEHADRVIAMRNGRVVEHVPTARLDAHAIELINGRHGGVAP